MPKTVMKAPVFRKTLNSGRDFKNKTVSVAFLGDDSKEYEINLAVECIPIAIFALANEQGRILSTLPAEDRPETQTIRGEAIVPAIGLDGAPALILRLEGGGELTIEYSKEAIAAVSAQLAELVKAMSKDQYH